MIIHVVSSGETLTQIAYEYNVNINDLAADNGLEPNLPLVVGQALVIQIPDVVHTVRRGETLTQIAREYKTTALALLRNNFKLNGSDRISTGETINISYAQQQKTKTFAVNSYAYPYINPKLLQSQLPYLTYFTPFTYGINEGGGLVYQNDEFMRTAADNFGVKNLLHLSTLTEVGNFSSERATLVFENETIANDLIGELAEYSLKNGFGGVDVDFEFIKPSEKYDYIRFLQDLRLKLNPLGLELFSALAPKTSDTQSGTLYEGHDYAGIAAAVNYVLLMTYEWGYTYSAPMAVAPINSVAGVVRYALTRMTSDKIFMGVPTYGYDWLLPHEDGGAGAPSISPVEAVNLARRYGADILYDETAQAPWFRYADDDGRLHEVWFEDARSISAKLAFAASSNLYGIGFWNLMREFPQNWVVLNAEYNIINFAAII